MLNLAAVDILFLDFVGKRFLIHFQKVSGLVSGLVSGFWFIVLRLSFFDQIVNLIFLSFICGPIQFLH